MVKSVDIKIPRLTFYLSCYGWIEEASQFVDVGVWGVLHLKPFLH